MKKRTTAIEEEAAIDLTPMLDVVFIMLIFFLVTTSFLKESGITVQTPEAQAASRQELGTIMLAIDSDGEIWLDQRNIDLRSIVPNLQRIRTEQPNGNVVIQADEAVRTGLLVKVMGELKSAGEKNIAVAAAVNANLHQGS